MRRILKTAGALLLLVAAACAAEDSWDKVRQLASGSELRIYQTGSRKPVTARLYRVSGDSLVVIVKNFETAIPKDTVERLDWRPADSAARVDAEARRVVGTRESAVTGRSGESNVPARSTLGGIRIRPPREFQTVYRRTGGCAQGR